jgi:hypothetical protein
MAAMKIYEGYRGDFMLKQRWIMKPVLILAVFRHSVVSKNGQRKQQIPVPGMRNESALLN